MSSIAAGNLLFMPLQAPDPASLRNTHGDNAGMKPHDITLGILAGGRASRLQGIDKAWLQREGVPQVLRLRRRFECSVDAMLVSANRNIPRYTQAGLQVVEDRVPDAGPLAGLDALARACTSKWMLTLPVDLVDVNDCLLPTLRAAANDAGAVAHDDDGLQPLVAFWNAAGLRAGCSRALENQELAVHALQSRLGMASVRFPGVRFGNLNLPADLAAAGIELR